nr:Ger(x)C family spore germination protein [Paenibacillus sacheonensis]
MVVLVFATCGCWTSAELNERAFARIMILDKSDSGVELTIGFPLPNRLVGGGVSGSGSMPSESPFTLVSKVGRDLGEAYQLIQADLSRRITFGQLRNILISDAFAQEGLLPLMDFLARNTEIHINANMIVTKGAAKQIGNIPLTFERFPTDILIAYAKHRTMMAESAKNVLAAILYGGGDFVLPIVQFGQIGAKTEKNAKHWMGTDGAALFRQGKLVSELDTKEMRAAMWLLGKPGEFVTVVDSPSDGKPVSLKLLGSASKIKPVLSGGRIRFIISCKGLAKVVASESTIDVTDGREIDVLEKSLNKDMQALIGRTVARTQANRTDPFKLGQRIRLRSPKTWDRLKGDWSDIYKNKVEIEVRTDLRIKWYGGARKPTWNAQLGGKEAKS